MENFLEAIWKPVPVISEGGQITIGSLLGIVAKKSDGHESWKAYCGVVSSTGTNINKEQYDIENIMKHGALLTEHEARAWFPNIMLPYRDI